MHRYSVAISVLGVILTGLVCRADAFESAGRKPNIIYILADDMGCGDVQALNPDGKIKTPNLDRMAANGIHFTDAHTTSGVCTPSRYSILTGRYNWRSPLKRGVLNGYSKALIPADRLTVPAFLKQHGYRTHCVGKWHLGLNWAAKDDAAETVTHNGMAALRGKDVDFTRPFAGGPTDLGFDSWFGVAASLDMPPYTYIRDDRVTEIPDRNIHFPRGYYRSGLGVEDFDNVTVLQKLTDEAVRVIGDWKAGEPHFLYFALTAPHAPHVPTEKWRGKSGINNYTDFCMQVDDQVGQVVRAVEKAGLIDKTLIIFTADNGCAKGAKFHQMIAKGHNPSMHFRGMKGDVYEGGHRVPFIAQWPGKIRPDTRSRQLISTVDLFATCAALVGGEIPETAAGLRPASPNPTRGPHPTGLMNRQGVPSRRPPIPAVVPTPEAGLHGAGLPPARHVAHPASDESRKK